jgi:hypothetical protein
MLKILAVVVLLAVVLPIHGQKEGSQSTGDKGRGNAIQSPAATPSGTATCVVKQEGTTIECRWPKDVPESKLSRFLSPENAPNIGLFFVGLGGVISAICTLRSINRQAGESRLQRVIMHKTLNSIREQANLMKRQADALDEQNKTTRKRERARLLIQNVSKPEFGPPDGLADGDIPVRIYIFVSNEGSTGAFNIKAVGAIRIEHGEFDGDFVEPSWSTLDTPKIITPSNGVNIAVTGMPIIPGCTPSEFTMIPPDFAKDVIESNKHLRISGAIYYDDLFDDPHSTPFDYVWIVTDSDGTAHWQDNCRWFNRSPPGT